MTPTEYMKDPRLPTIMREAKAFLAWPNTTPSPDEHMAQHMAAFGLQILDAAHSRVRTRDEIEGRIAGTILDNEILADRVTEPPDTLRKLADLTQQVANNTIRLEMLYWVTKQEDK